MGKCAQIVLGPAGSGKTTYCDTMAQYFESVKRTAHVVNLDPACDELPYNPSIDIRELVEVEKVMEEYDLGPNGGLVWAMEYFVENLEWFAERLGDYDDDYLILDCPGRC